MIIVLQNKSTTRIDTGTIHMSYSIFLFLPLLLLLA